MARQKTVKNKKVKGKVRRKSKKPAVKVETPVVEDPELVLPALADPVSILTEEIKKRADLVLTDDETSALTSYIKNGGRPLAIQTSLAFFELFLSGYDCKAIHDLNSAFPLQSIVWARIQHEWDKKKDSYMDDLHAKIVNKVSKAQLETTNLMADLLTATTKKYGNKIKRYIQTENEEDLGDTLQIVTVNQLLKLVDGLQKITGQDKTKIIKNQIERTENVNLNVGDGTPEPTGPTLLEETEAADVLEILAKARRRKAREDT